MATNANSSDLVVANALADSRTAGLTDAKRGERRHETSLFDASQNQRVEEANMRQTANLEIGRARNLSRVV